MIGESPPEVAGEANVVKLAPTVEGVNALPPPHVLAHYVLILFQRITGDVFHVLADKSRSLHWFLFFAIVSPHPRGLIRKAGRTQRMPSN
jgi:hypothetical protein